MFFFFNDTATTEIYTLSLHDALPICWYLLVLIGIPLLMLLGAFVVLGTVPLDALAHNWPVIFTGYPIYVVYIAIFTGMGEEPGPEAARHPARNSSRGTSAPASPLHERRNL